MSEKINEISIELLKIQRSHIETLLAIIKHLQEKMILSLDCDDEDRIQIINELIFYIDQLVEEEK